MTWVMVVQTLVLAITAWLVWRYTIETAALRKEMVRQNNLSLRPLVLPEFRRDEHGKLQFWVRNVGNACAVNVEISPRKIADPKGGPFEVRFQRCSFLPSGKDNLMEFSTWLGGSPYNSNDPGGYYPPFPSQPLGKTEESTISFSDVEGQRYRIVITIHPGQGLPITVDVGRIERL